LKVKAKERFQYYRNASLKLDIKEFRKLKEGKVADIPENKVKEYPDLYEIVEAPKTATKQEVKDGN
jgi:hypothetical protein